MKGRWDGLEHPSRRLGHSFFGDSFAIYRFAFDAVGGEELVAVGGNTVGDMEPVAVKLIDELVVGKVEADEEIAQTAVVLRAVGNSADIGSLTEEML